MAQEMLWEGEKEKLLSSSRSCIYNQLSKCLASFWVDEYNVCPSIWVIRFKNTIVGLWIYIPFLFSYLG